MTAAAAAGVLFPCYHGRLTSLYFSSSGIINHKVFSSGGVRQKCEQIKGVFRQARKLPMASTSWRHSAKWIAKAWNHWSYHWSCDLWTWTVPTLWINHGNYQYCPWNKPQGHGHGIYRCTIHAIRDRTYGWVSPARKLRNPSNNLYGDGWLLISYYICK